MILSHKHRFIFVKGSKVAGTSAELALSAICGPDDIITPVTPVDDRLRIGAGHLPRHFALDPAVETEYIQRVRDSTPENLHEIATPPAGSRFYNHMPLTEIEGLVDFPIDDFAVVVIERNPYEKVISIANWMYHAAAYHRGQPIRFDIGVTRQVVDKLIQDRVVLRARNIDRYKRRSGELRLKVLRFETLQADFAALMKDLRVPEPFPALPHVKNGNWKARPEDVLLPAQIGVINRLFSEEFAYFGYPMLQTAAIVPP